MRFPLIPFLSLLLLACQPDGLVRENKTETKSEAQAVKGSNLLKKKSYIRDLFLESARRSLFNYPEAIRQHAGDEAYNKMLALLNEEAVQLSLDPLLDNRGNAVAALGVPGKITLYVGVDGDEELGWEKLMARGQVFEQIVLHELLRAADVDDDDYIITRKIIPYYLNFNLPADQIPVTPEEIQQRGIEFSHPTLDGSTPEIRSYTLSMATTSECGGAWCKVLIEQNGEIIHSYPNPGEDSILPVGMLMCRTNLKYEHETQSFDFSAAKAQCQFSISEPSQN